MKKRLLFIGTEFFNIEKQIISEIEKQNYIVDFFSDRPSQNSFVKGILKINPKIINPINKRYFDKIVAQTQKNKYDKVFVLNGKIINEEFIKKLTDKFKEAEFIYYTYDTLNLYPHALDTLKYYDRIYTFDMRDSKEHYGLKLLPLFFDKGLVAEANKIGEEIDVLSVCTAHTNRYKIIKELFPLLEKKDISIFSFLYLNKLQFIYNKLFVKEFRKAKAKDFSFTPLSSEDNFNLMYNSKVVFDVEHSAQTGLTMRTIEALGFKKKLITTNSTIEKYNFFNPNNIFILKENYNVDELVKFINMPQQKLSDKIYFQYEKENFIATILGLKEVDKYIC